MPRVIRRGHKKRGEGQYSRAEIIHKMSTGWEFFDGVKSPMLEHYSERERAAIWEEVQDAFYARKWAERQETLRDRIKTWKTWMWNELFLEWPELEKELTPNERARWEEHSAKKRAEAQASGPVKVVPITGRAAD